jgi:hypothetical protein
MKKIYKKYDKIEDICEGDILEISSDIFVKITKLTKDVEESLGGTVVNQKNYEAVVIDLNGK